jgi:4'-phosphopantetheinyl transferase
MQPPLLERTHIHVWTTSLWLEDDAVTHMHAVLSADERSKARRYWYTDDRRRFVVARAFLRRLLSIYLQTDVSLLHLDYTSHGKPMLTHCLGMRFNLSHAEDTAIAAVALDREVGIDIEATNREVDVTGVARQMFSPTECQALASLSPAARRDAFFRIWTRKEAYIKARGAGLSYPTRSFSVSLHPEDNDALLSDENEIGAPREWRVAEIPAPDGFRAAVAAEGRDWSVVQMPGPVRLDAGVGTSYP